MKYLNAPMATPEPHEGYGDCDDRTFFVPFITMGYPPLAKIFFK